MLDRRSMWLLLASLMSAMFVSGLNQSVVATATPRMLADLGGFSLLSWVFIVYMLASTVATPLVGKLSDTYGRRVFLLSGLGVFVLGSAGCGASTSMPMLIAFRALQGMGGGTVMACVFASLGDLFSPADRGKYIGLFTGTMTIAGLSGPSVGGLLTDHAGWRACFYVSIPVAAVAATFIYTNMPARSRERGKRPIDFLGATVLSCTTTMFLLAVTWAHKAYGWGSPVTSGMIAGSALLLVLFVLQERRHPEAILPPAVFRNRQFVVANLIAFCFAAGTFGAVQYLPTFVQTSLRGSATASGLVTTPQSMGMLITSVIGGQLIARRGKYKPICIAGALCAAAAVLLLRTVDAGEPAWHLSAFVFMLGLGSGLVMPTVSLVSQNSVSHEFMGVATGARQFFMQIGNVAGVTLFGIILTTSYGHAFDHAIAGTAASALPPELAARFDDPTLALNRREFALVQDDVRRLDGGEEMLSAAVAGQRSAVATAIHAIFAGSAILVTVVFGLTMLLRQVPLRRGSGAAPARPPAHEHRATAALLEPEQRAAQEA